MMPTDHWHKFNDPRIAYMGYLAQSTQAQMTITTIALVSSTSATNNTSLVLTKNVTQNNWLVVNTGGSITTAPTISTTSGGTNVSGWTLDTGTSGGAIWHATVNGGVGTVSITVTVTMGNSANQATLSEWTGVGGVDSTTARNTGTSGAATPTSATPTLGNVLYVAEGWTTSALNFNGTVASGTGGPFTALGTSGFKAIGCYVVVTNGSSTQQPQMQLPSSGAWSACSARYYPTVTTGWVNNSGTRGGVNTNSTSPASITLALTPLIGDLIYVSFGTVYGTTGSSNAPVITDNQLASGGAPWYTIDAAANTTAKTSSGGWAKVANVFDYNGGSGLTVTVTVSGGTGTVTSYIEGDVFTPPSGNVVAMTGSAIYGPIFVNAGTALTAITNNGQALNDSVDYVPATNDFLSVQGIFTAASNGGIAAIPANWIGNGTSVAPIAFNVVNATNVVHLASQWAAGSSFATDPTISGQGHWTSSSSGRQWFAVFEYQLAPGNFFMLLDNL